jgi:hypothetical protein
MSFSLLQNISFLTEMLIWAYQVITLEMLTGYELWQVESQFLPKGDAAIVPYKKAGLTY